MATFTEHLWYFCSFHFNDNPPTPPQGFFFFFFFFLLSLLPKGKNWGQEGGVFSRNVGDHTPNPAL